jgi:DNA-binding CsgD family transcriptional regulator
MTSRTEPAFGRSRIDGFVRQGLDRRRANWLGPQQLRSAPAGRLGDTGGVSEQILRARDAFNGCRWATAHEGFCAVGEPLSVEDSDRLATAAYLIGRDEESFALWAELHHGCEKRGATAQAARFGLRLAEAVGFQGDIPRAQGWVLHVQRLLDRAGLDCVEQGYLAHASAMCRIFTDGDVAAAHLLFAQAVKWGERFADAELLTLARIGEGRCQIYMGEVSDGIGLLDEAMVSVESGQLAPIVVGDAYCTVIDACAEIFDVRRLGTWTQSFSLWCDDQPELVLYRGHCRLHRAEVLTLRGRWAEALAEATSAVELLAEPRNLMALGGAHYVKAELHRLRGDLADAEQEYRCANGAGCPPFPGLAQLRLAQGQTGAACSALRRALAEADGAVARARLLPSLVQALIAAGELDEASAAASDLAEVADELQSPYLRAAADSGVGAVRVAGGDAEVGIVSLRRAWEGWRDLGIPLEEAQTRLLIAAACRALGDDDGAELESSAAQTTLDELGSALVSLLPEAARTMSGAAGQLTPREMEVLVHLAGGRTNRAIAGALFISEKTVASHVGHIFTKLGVTSRSAATAYAYEHKLVGGG